MRRFILLKILFVMSFAFVHCESRYRGESPREIAARIRAGESPSASSCQDNYCCNNSRECVQACDRIFLGSNDSTRRICQSLDEETVFLLEDIAKALRQPLANYFKRIDPREEFRLLLALDYRIWINMIKVYTIDDARQALVWIAGEPDIAKELMYLEMSERNEILYEILASAGDRTKRGPVGEGLTRSVSFDETFFELLVDRRNDNMLQITHEMIRDDLCQNQYAGSRKVELCMLRVYCRENPNVDGQYMHSRDVRSEIARRIKDEEFFQYVAEDILRIGSYTYLEPLLDDNVCQLACNDSAKGCE